MGHVDRRCGRGGEEDGHREAPFAAVYLLWGYQQVFHGEPTEEDAGTADLTVNQRLIVAPLIILIVLLGVFPKPVLDRITPSVNRLVVHVDQVTDTPVPAGLRPAVAAKAPCAVNGVRVSCSVAASASPGAATAAKGASR